ncbi:MAG TPA: hypothetical protein VFX37_16080 [Pseudolabrys sp.]|nr:hypothetical protein [Pseudolabrys sp.]
MNTTDGEAPLGGDIEQLLPWHAAGTLNRRDAQRVERALAQDADLARRYELVREELDETIRLNETLGAPSARAMEKLFTRIDAEPARTSSLRLSIGARVAEFFAGLSPRTLVWSASAAAIAIILQAGFIVEVMVGEKPSAGYQTASAPSAPAADGTYVLIRFAPQATATDITSFLETNKASIVSGPSAGGLYRVRIAETAVPKAQATNLVKKLQENKSVDFIATTQ